ncbi:MAG: rhomboid family intramembrane serine protease [Candidatus Aphodocola sp.]
MKVINYLSYNSVIILSFFFISLFALILNYLTKGKSNILLFSSYRSSVLNPLTYLRLITHIFGHASWSHFMNNFLYILLIGPMIEEKYGSINLIIMILSTAVITGILNTLFSKKRILGASGIVFMLIILSSFVNITTGKIPVTLILICIFYVVNEIISGIFKKDDISHIGHLIGAICGFVFGFYIFK